MIYDVSEKSKELLASIRGTVENTSIQVNDIVKEIIEPYCKDLDNYIRFIANCLKDGEKPPTTTELEDFCMNLSTYIYFAGGMCEQLGIKDDISKAVWREVYNTARDNNTQGTVADRNTQAELQSQHEQLTNICYSRAYKTMKAKVDAAQELLSSCKKVLSHRMQEEQLTHMMSTTADSKKERWDY
jgi:hypothetical protein